MSGVLENFTLLFLSAYSKWCFYLYCLQGVWWLHVSTSRFYT